MKTTTFIAIRRLSILAILFLLSTVVLTAQVKIKSRVEIKPGSMQSHQSSIGQLKKTSDEQDFVIIQRSGTLELYFRIIFNDGPIQGNPYIKLSVGGKEYTNYTFPYSTEYIYTYDARQNPYYCPACEPIHMDYYYSVPDDSHTIFIPVHANDTLRLVYHSDQSYTLTPQINDTGDWISFWFSKGSTYYKPCLCGGSGRYLYNPEGVDGSLFYRPDIMLGESKYFQASYVYDDRYQQVYLNELTDPHEHVGDYVAEDIKFTVEPLNGSKCGVYWEQVNTEGKPDTTGDIIRLIGRYWEKDSTFAVKVTAWFSGINSDYWTPTTIYTSAPDRLGNDYGPDGNGGRKKTVSNVFGNPYNLDSVIIKYAGMYGLPPQILKADMQQEGNFQPAYRWEPFVDAGMIHNPKNNYMDDDFRYKKTNSDEGSPGIPTTHINVSPILYPRNDFRTIWDRFFDQSKTLNLNRSVNRYPIETWWSKPASDWTEKFNTELISLLKQKVNSDNAKNQARAFADSWLKDEYRDGIMSEGIAQTRTAVSYGLMQMLYSTAVDVRHYHFDRTNDDPNHLPEYLNITDTNLTYAVPFLLKQINSELIEEGDGAGKLDNWTLGFERTIIVALNMYNGKVSKEPTPKYPITRYNSKYGFDVMDKVPQYLPKNR